jgi:hypothetical protein
LGISDATNNIWEWCVLTHSLTKKAETSRRSFAAFGDPFNIYQQGERERELFAVPPGEFEYAGESSIGFRCALAATTMDVSSVSFSRPDRLEEMQHRT